MEPTNQGEGPQEVAKLSQVIQIDEEKIQEHLGEDHIRESSKSSVLKLLLASILVPRSNLYPNLNLLS